MELDIEWFARLATLIGGPAAVLMVVLYGVWRIAKPLLERLVDAHMGFLKEMTVVAQAQATSMAKMAEYLEVIRTHCHSATAIAGDAHREIMKSAESLHDRMEYIIELICSEDENGDGDGDGDGDDDDEVQPS